ncbi:cell division protein ZapA [Pseudooceanicola sp. CBS1P-1]|uniref:Cell division protein ZapA n=1 Tax=Pseudooceanicola albus TaxID=2692189 RepID=A0A6L7GBJ6_9RHOB|nr:MULTISPECIES: cell division protein ZapA [Pseudooceanicola]MBT9384449.1 cell division protein ZapA [Pseudooceanicola endophyticus]MXN20650.1 cell division protein ZapA [Pseudooceanicola albus]
MPNVTVTIGGRSFDVACEAGQESFLRYAADQLDQEAQALLGQTGRIPEATMLLMAGLMLADRTGRAEERITTLQHEIEALKEEVTNLRNQPAPAPEKVEVVKEVEVEVVREVVPPSVQQALADLAERAEYLAHQIAAKAGTAE